MFSKLIYPNIFHDSTSTNSEFPVKKCFEYLFKSTRAELDYQCHRSRQYVFYQEILNSLALLEWSVAQNIDSFVQFILLTHETFIQVTFPFVHVLVWTECGLSQIASIITSRFFVALKTFQ